jgi:hypothetical protein
MAETAQKSTVQECLLFFLARKPTLSSDSKMRLERSIAKLHSDGVDVGSLCRRVIGLEDLPDEERSSILSRFSSADQRRIKALPKNLRAIAVMLKKEDFDFFLRWGAQRCPGMIETLKYLSLNLSGLFPIRDGSRRGDLFLKLPEILEDIAQAIENTIKHPPKRVTFAMRLTRIVGQVEVESRSRREHYREILDLLDPEGRSPRTYDGIKNLVARQRARPKSRSYQSK